MPGRWRASGVRARQPRRRRNRAQSVNFGALVDLTVPGGETAVQANGVPSTLDIGTTPPAAVEAPDTGHAGHG